MAKEGQAQVDKAIEGQFGKLPKPKKLRKKFEIKMGDNQVVEAQEVHCIADGRFLGYQAVVWGLSAFKCPICGEFTIIEVNPDKGDIDNLPNKS